MTKRAVVILYEGSTDDRVYSRVIRIVKSPRIGAYVFDEQMVPNEDVKKFFKN